MPSWPTQNEECVAFYMVHSLKPRNLSLPVTFLSRSGESEPGDGRRGCGGGRDGDHQLSGEEQR